MALESPAWVISASSHSAALFRQATQSIISGTGVVGLNDLLTTQNGTPNMSVNVAPGFIWCPGTLGATSGIQANGNAQTSYGLPSGLTSQGCYGAYNDATVNLPISAADPSNPRIDIVCASIQDAQYAGSNNQPLLSIVTGTAAPSPSAPSAPASSVVLAQVAVGAGVTSITSGNITDERPRLALNRTPGPTLLNYGSVVAGSGAPTAGSPFLMQAGTWSGNYLGNVTTVNFPTAFPTGLLSVLVVSGAAPVGMALAVNSSCSAAHFAFRLFGTTGVEISSGTAVTVNWVALGW